MEITLLRHGKPDFDWTGYAKADEIKDLVEIYDLAGIIDAPPEKAMFLVKNHDFIVCSDLRRSLQSAKALGVNTVHLSDTLYRELQIPTFDKGFIKLPIKLWVGILRGLWFLGLSNNTDSLTDSRQRAKLACQKLIELAKQYDRVLLVGHGMINYYIAKELLMSGWFGPSNTGRKYWEFATYRDNDS